MIGAPPPNSPTISRPISRASNSCPATNLAAVSPTPPPAASTAKPLAAALVAAFPTPTAPFVILPAIPPVRPSTIPITAPLDAALVLIRLKALGSSKTLRIPSSSNSPPLFSTSSCKNSVKDSAVSNVPDAPAMAPDTAPIPVPIPGSTDPATAPAPAPPPAAAADAGLIIATNEEAIVSTAA